MDDKVDLLAEMEAEESNSKPEQNPSSNIPVKFKLAVLGDRDKTVAIRTLFDQPQVDVRNFERVDDLVQWLPNLTFVCLDVPLLQNDTLEDSEVIDAVSKILNTTKSGICLKSEISPETVERIFSSVNPEMIQTRLVYNPTVENDIEDIDKTLCPDLIVLGGAKEATDALLSVYATLSNMIVDREKIISSTIMDAALFKVAYTGFKAVTQTFFNQLYDVANEYDGVNYNMVRTMFTESKLLQNVNALTIPTFVRVKESENLSYKRARAYKGEYMNRDVRIFSSLSDKIPLIDECINYKNLKDQ